MSSVFLITKMRPNSLLNQLKTTILFGLDFLLEQIYF